MAPRYDCFFSKSLVDSPDDQLFQVCRRLAGGVRNRGQNHVRTAPLFVLFALTLFFAVWMYVVIPISFQMFILIVLPRQADVIIGTVLNPSRSSYTDDLCTTGPIDSPLVSDKCE